MRGKDRMAGGQREWHNLGQRGRQAQVTTAPTDHGRESDPVQGQRKLLKEFKREYSLRGYFLLLFFSEKNEFDDQPAAALYSPLSASLIWMDDTSWPASTSDTSSWKWERASNHAHIASLAKYIFGFLICTPSLRRWPLSLMNWTVSSAHIIFARLRLSPSLSCHPIVVHTWGLYNKGPFNKIKTPSFRLIHYAIEF